jgi:hypothetical protein
MSRHNIPNNDIDIKSKELNIILNTEGDMRQGAEENIWTKERGTADSRNYIMRCFTIFLFTFFCQDN